MSTCIFSHCVYFSMLRSIRETVHVANGKEYYWMEGMGIFICSMALGLISSKISM